MSATQYIGPDGSISGQTITNGATVAWPDVGNVTVLLAEVTLPAGYPADVATGILAAAVRDIEKHNRSVQAGGSVLATKVTFS